MVSVRAISSRVNERSCSSSPAPNDDPIAFTRGRSVIDRIDAVTEIEAVVSSPLQPRSVSTPTPPVKRHFPHSPSGNRCPPIRTAHRSTRCLRGCCFEQCRPGEPCRTTHDRRRIPRSAVGKHELFRLGRRHAQEKTERQLIARAGYREREVAKRLRLECHIGRKHVVRQADRIRDRMPTHSRLRRYPSRCLLRRDTYPIPRRPPVCRCLRRRRAGHASKALYVSFPPRP